MNRPAKKLLVYADGRVVEFDGEIAGNMMLLREEVADGEIWVREFKCEAAMRCTEKDPEGRKTPYTMIAVERSFRPDPAVREDLVRCLERLPTPQLRRLLVAAKTQEFKA